MSSNGIPRPN